MAFINLMEKMVELKMEEHLKGTNVCRCEQCIDDIKCIALNNLPPKYVSTNKGELFSKIDQQMDRQHTTDIEISVLNAINFVEKHKRH